MAQASSSSSSSLSTSAALPVFPLLPEPPLIAALKTAQGCRKAEAILDLSPAMATVLQPDGTPLLWMAIDRCAIDPLDSARAVQLLLSSPDEGGLHTFRDQDGQNALHRAADKSHSAALEVLLKKAKDVDVQDSKGETPLHIAVRKGCYSSFIALLKARALFSYV